MSANLQLEQQGSILHIVLDRPEKRNALNSELCHALAAAFDRGDTDRSIHAMLLSANGKAFCAGMDLNEVLEPPPGLGEVHEQLFTTGARVTKPIIAAVHGATLGGGVGVVANAHIAVAARDATFGLTEIRIGLWPLLIFRAVAQALGERRTVELSLSGRIFDAAEAREFGLVHHVVDGDPLTRAREIAETVAGYSQAAMRSGLTFVGEVRGRGPSEAAQLARHIREQVFRSPEFRRSVEAFLKKE